MERLQLSRKLPRGARKHSLKCEGENTLGWQTLPNERWEADEQLLIFLSFNRAF